MAKERNYIMYKKGYKRMLEDLQEAKKNLSRFKGGLSVFEDDVIRSQLLSSTAAPVLSDDELRQNLQQVVLSQAEAGPLMSISQNVSKLSGYDATSYVNATDGGPYMQHIQSQFDQSSSVGAIADLDRSGSRSPQTPETIEQLPSRLMISPQNSVQGGTARNAPMPARRNLEMRYQEQRGC